MITEWSWGIKSPCNIRGSTVSMALYRSVWYDTDYESDEEPIKVQADLYALFMENDLTDFYYKHRLDSEIIKKSSFYDWLKGKSEIAFKQFVDLETNHIALLRALQLSRTARYQFRRFVELTYGHPSQETSSAGDQAQQRISSSSPFNGAARSNTSRGKSNDHQDSGASACGSFKGDDDDGGTATTNGGSIGDGQANA
jgi:hypothetical protein